MRGLHKYCLCQIYANEIERQALGEKKGGIKNKDYFATSNK